MKLVLPMLFLSITLLLLQLQLHQQHAFAQDSSVPASASADSSLSVPTDAQLSSMSISSLKRFLRLRSLSCPTCVEKVDLVRFAIDHKDAQVTVDEEKEREEEEKKKKEQEEEKKRKEEEEKRRKEEKKKEEKRREKEKKEKEKEKKKQKEEEEKKNKKENKDKGKDKEKEKSKEKEKEKDKKKDLKSEWSARALSICRSVASSRFPKLSSSSSSSLCSTFSTFVANQFSQFMSSLGRALGKNEKQLLTTSLKQPYLKAGEKQVEKLAVEVLRGEVKDEEGLKNLYTKTKMMQWLMDTASGNEKNMAMLDFDMNDIGDWLKSQGMDAKQFNKQTPPSTEEPSRSRPKPSRRVQEEDDDVEHIEL